MVALGFSDDGERLRGPVSWSPAAGELVTARVEVIPTTIFPFAPPRVTVLDPGTAFEPTFHVDRDGVLCLWEDEWALDEAPWLDPQMIVARIADWMEQTAAGWPGDDSCDLERYLPSDPTTFVMYDADALVFDVPVRTRSAPPRGTVTVTGEKRKIRALNGGRRRRKDQRLAWITDIGAVTRPLRAWDDVATALGRDADEVARLINLGAVTVLLLRYTHGGAPGALAFRVQRTHAGIEVTACESADTSMITRGLRAGPAAPQLGEVAVAVVGCGAIGSFAADLLFRSGVRCLTLLDGERLRPGNIVRHLAGVEHCGQPKTEAVRACLTRVDPDVARVSAHGPLAHLNDAVALIRTHRVVLDATGSARATSLLAAAAHLTGGELNHAVVSVCVQRDGGVLRGDRMPLRHGETHLPALPLLDDNELPREHGCGNPVSPTPPGAVAAAADLALRMVVDEALGERTLPATVAEVRSAQPEPPFDRPGLLTSADYPLAVAS